METRRPQHGDTLIPAALLNAHTDGLWGLSESALPDGAPGPGGQLLLPPAGPDWILARVTAKDASTPALYSWERVAEQANGATATHPDTGFIGGTPANYPAVEDNGQNVPLGTIIRLFPALGQPYWRFNFGGGGGPPPAGEVCAIDGGANWTDLCDPVTGSGGSFTVPLAIKPPSGPAVTVYYPGGPPSYQLTVHPADVGLAFYWHGAPTYVYQLFVDDSGVSTTMTWPGGGSNTKKVDPPGNVTDEQKPGPQPGASSKMTYRDGSGAAAITVETKASGGALGFGSTTDPTKPPPGRLDDPLYNHAGKPTWTPDPGTYPHGYDPIDKKDYQWNGTSWDTFSPDPLTTKGDLWAYGATDARLPVGTDTAILRADSSQATGLAWGAQYALVDAKGDLIVGTANDTAARLLVGSDGQVLTADAASAVGVKWSTPASSVPTSYAGWVKIGTFTPASFTAAANTRRITAYTLAIRGIITKAVLRTKTVFSGGAITGYTCTLYIAGNSVFSNHDCRVAGLVTQGHEGSGNPYLATIFSFTATTAVELEATSTGAFLNAATAGELEFWIEVGILP